MRAASFCACETADTSTTWPRQESRRSVPRASTAISENGTSAFHWPRKRTTPAPSSISAFILAPVPFRMPVSSPAIAPPPLVVARLKVVLHQLLDLVGEQVLVDRRDLEDAHVVAAAQVLQQRVAGLLVQRHDDGLRAVQGGLHDVVELVGVHLHLADLVDDDDVHVLVRDGVLDGLHADAVEGVDVDEVVAVVGLGLELRLELLRREDLLLAGAPVLDVEAYPD